MKRLELLRFAATGLRGHGLRTLLTVAGVSIGVASVILLTSLGEGARLYVVGEFSSIGSNLLIVIPGKTETRGAAPFVNSAPHDLTVEDAEALLQRVPLLRRVSPISLGTAKAEFGGRDREVTLVGTTAPMLEIRHLQMGIGRFLPEGVDAAPLCVLGAKVQRELFGRENPLGQTIRVGGTRLRVIGVIAPRGASLGMNLDEVVEVPVRTGLRMFDRSSLFRILAEVRSPTQIEEAKRQVIAILTERHGDEEDVTVLTQDAVLSTFDRIFSILTLALGAIAAISLSVAGVGIMNVMLVSVSERTREIGLLKALGVTRRQVMGIFLAEAAILSLLGGTIGLAIGLGGGSIMRSLAPAFPVQPPPWAVVLAVVVSVSVGLIFGAMPARRAMRLDPIEALMRHRA